MLLPLSLSPILLLLGQQAPSPSSTFDSSSAYEQQTLHGFPILVNSALWDHSREAEQALAELEQQLRAVEQVMTAEPLAALRKVRIWLEWDKRKNGAAEFH